MLVDPGGRRHNLDVLADSSYDAAHLFVVEGKEGTRSRRHGEQKLLMADPLPQKRPIWLSGHFASNKPTRRVPLLPRAPGHRPEFFSGRKLRLALSLARPKPSHKNLSSACTTNQTN